MWTLGEKSWFFWIYSISSYKIVLLLSVDHVLICAQFEVTFLPPNTVTPWSRQSSQIQQTQSNVSKLITLNTSQKVGVKAASTARARRFYLKCKALMKSLLENLGVDIAQVIGIVHWQVVPRLNEVFANRDPISFVSPLGAMYRYMRVWRWFTMCKSFLMGIKL